MSNEFKNRARLGVENLESREMMSWGAVPPSVVPSGGDRWDITAFSNDGVYRDTDSITRGEVESYTFTAQRTGTYTLTAKAATGSSIDTVIALYNSSGTRLAYNDDASSSTTNSKMTANLTAGHRYTFSLSNYTGSANGSFNVKITPPAITGFDSTGLGRTYSSGDATLNGTTLTLNLYGQTKDLGYYTDHYIRVQIVDRNGVPIHSGFWSGSFRTDELFWTGDPNTRSRTWTFDVSGFDLSRASRVVVDVGY